MIKIKLSVAVIGAGMGGLTAAAMMHRLGMDVQVYEQAPAFARLGAGIQQGPNAVKALRGIGLEERLRDVAFRPEMTRYRDATDGAIKWERTQGDLFEEKYGAPHLLLHRAELHGALASAVPEGLINLGKTLTAFENGPDGVQMSFADGTTAEADIMIAADGVHSIVRDHVSGPSEQTFTGRVAYRTTFPASLMNGREIEGSTKWMAEDRHIVIYYLNENHDEIYFVTSTPEPAYDVESWSTKGDMDELRAAYSGFHEEVRAVMEACPSAHKWALVTRKPLPTWHKGRVALLGDACHPMTPYMAQGAGMAIEDAAILARCLNGIRPEGVSDAFAQYEAIRKPRASWVQASSGTNDINLYREQQDRLFSYDAWTAPLETPA